MFKKFNFILSALFAPFVFADIHMPASGEVNHMSDMMSDNSVEDSGFWGSIELKYTYKNPPAPAASAEPAGDTADGEQEAAPAAAEQASGDSATGPVSPSKGASYRARVGWKGDVNETIKWGVSVSSRIEGEFVSPSVKSIGLEQAYVHYSPVEGFSIKAGKYGWKTKFHKTGVLYDDDLYSEGVYAKYYYGERDGTNVYVKAILHQLGSKDWSGPLASGSVVAAKAGGAYEVSDGMALGAYASVENDALFKADGHTPKTLAKAGLHFNVSDIPVPAGAYAVYTTDVENIGFDSYTAGVYVGSAGCPKASEAYDFGVSVNYYDIKTAHFNTSLLDTDYVAGPGRDAKGVAARAQYNLWDNANAVIKYAYDLDAATGNEHNVVGEATFNF